MCFNHDSSERDESLLLALSNFEIGPVTFSATKSFKWLFVEILNRKFEKSRSRAAIYWLLFIANPFWLIKSNWLASMFSFRRFSLRDDISCSIDTIKFRFDSLPKNYRRKKLVSLTFFSLKKNIWGGLSVYCDAESSSLPSLEVIYRPD